MEDVDVGKHEEKFVDEGGVHGPSHVVSDLRRVCRRPLQVLAASPSTSLREYKAHLEATAGVFFCFFGARQTNSLNLSLAPVSTAMHITMSVVHNTLQHRSLQRTHVLSLDLPSNRISSPGR